MVFIIGRTSVRSFSCPPCLALQACPPRPHRVFSLQWNYQSRWSDFGFGRRSLSLAPPDSSPRVNEPSSILFLNFACDPNMTVSPFCETTSPHKSSSFRSRRQSLIIPDPPHEVLRFLFDIAADSLPLPSHDSSFFAGNIVASRIFTGPWQAS